MAEEFNDSYESEQGKSKSNIFLIVVLIFVVLCCCCCAAVAALYYGIEPAFQLLGISIPWY